MPDLILRCISIVESHSCKVEVVSANLTAGFLKGFDYENVDGRSQITLQ